MLMTEHAGKRLLMAHGVAVPGGRLIRRAGQVGAWSGGYPVAIKAQVAAGGRGKAGGVLRADDAAAAAAAAERLFALEIGGERPRALLVEPWMPHERELYLAVTIDAQAGGYVVLYSPRGGVDVEEQAPSRYAFGAPADFRAHALRAMLSDVEADAALRERIVVMARRLLFLATAVDAVTVEINPLAVLGNGRLLALDAKVVRDESAAYRQHDLADAMKAGLQREPRMVRRAVTGKLMMVALDGDIGLISGGAGMTMAAMDMLAASGLRPACFLDCSSNPTPAGYRLAFSLLDAEPRVRGILISIFGGGTHIDRVARVMSEIVAERRSRKPVVFRMNGTGRDQADVVMRDAGLHNHPTIESAIATLKTAVAA